MEPAQALMAIQTMADHSQKWHDGSSSRNIDSSSNSEGIATNVNKLDSLGRDMKKLKENMHAIQVGCQTCGGAHLDKECPLNEDVKIMEEVKYGEFDRPFPNNSRNDEEEAKRHAKQDKWLKKFYQNTEINREAHDKLSPRSRSIDGLPLYTPFYYSLEEIEYFFANSGFLDKEKQETDKSKMEEALAALEAKLEIKKKHHAKEALIYETMESLKKIKINRPLLKEIRKTDDYAKHMKNLVANKPRTKEEEVRMNPRLHFNNALVDLEASISIMPLSMYKCLGIGKLEPINMMIEMADNTKCTPKGLVENLLVKINKLIFPVDFVILDIVEDIRMPIILGRPLLPTTHAKVDIFRKSISLEVGHEKVIFRIRSSFDPTIFESVHVIKSTTCLENDDLNKMDYDLFLYEIESCKFNHLLVIDHTRR
ncbi:zinc knuckle CX2CX4HX4C containing protein [Tanacetum coccineum]